MRTDLRAYLISPRLAAPRAELHDAPRLSPTPGRPVVVAAAVPAVPWRLGDEVDDQVDDQVEAETLTETLWGYWNTATTGLHRLVYGTGTGLLTGLTVPREATDPTAARHYLGDLMLDMGEICGWPKEETQRRARAMLEVGNAAGVAGTIQRCAAFGPPSSWPNARAWYMIAGEMRRAAALTAAGETAAVFRTASGDVAETIKRGTRDLSDKVDRGLGVAEKGSGAFGTGAGVAMVAAGALGLAWFFGPEIAAAKTVKTKATGARS